MDDLKNNFQRKHIKLWNQVSPLLNRPQRTGVFYQKLIQHHYKHLIQPGLRIIEFGCGHGDLLASLNPSFGVGVDFSAEMLQQSSKRHQQLYFIQADAHEIVLKEKFDVIILSDIVNDLWDVQCVLELIDHLSHARTRVIINFFNNMWRVPLLFALKLIRGITIFEQNWFAPHDIFNLLNLSGFEIVKYNQRILLPFHVPIISTLLNRYIVNITPFNWFALTNFVVARPISLTGRSLISGSHSVSIIIPARNEAGNIENIFRYIPDFDGNAELIFVEGHSKDNTYEVIKEMIKKFPEKNCRVLRQKGKGKGDAVRLGFENAKGEIFLILDADSTVPPEDLIRFYDALVSGRGEFINGVRLVYPIENQAMRFFNMVGNKFFSIAFSWLLGQPVKDTLCGTKAIWRCDYEKIAKNRSYFGDFDPFGDFDLLFGASKLNLKIVDLPVRYRSRTYGETNIKRWQHGFILLKMLFISAYRLKFI